MMQNNIEYLYVGPVQYWPVFPTSFFNSSSTQVWFLRPFTSHVQLWVIFCIMRYQPATL